MAVIVIKQLLFDIQFRHSFFRRWLSILCIYGRLIALLAQCSLSGHLQSTRPAQRRVIDSIRCEFWSAGPAASRLSPVLGVGYAPVPRRTSWTPKPQRTAPHPAFIRLKPLPLAFSQQAAVLPEARPGSLASEPRSFRPAFRPNRCRTTKARPNAIRPAPHAPAASPDRRPLCDRRGRRRPR